MQQAALSKGRENTGVMRNDAKSGKLSASLKLLCIPFILQWCNLLDWGMQACGFSKASTSSQPMMAATHWHMHKGLSDLIALHACEQVAEHNPHDHFTLHRGTMLT